MAEPSEKDIIEQLEEIEQFYEDPDSGVVPIELLAERGTAMPASSDLDDESLHHKLWEIIEAMASIGIFLESTDHLSDRDLYDYLRDDALRQPTVLFPDDPTFGEHIDPIGGFGPEEIEIYLRYYADDEIRDRWREDFPDDVVPAKEKPPYDRDRFLPTHEDKLFGAAH